MLRMCKRGLFRVCGQARGSLLRQPVQGKRWSIPAAWLSNDWCNMELPSRKDGVFSFRGYGTGIDGRPGIDDTRHATNDSQDGFKEDEPKEPADEKTQVLRAALCHVPKLGWSEAAIAAGARDTGLSPAIAGAFPRKEANLVEFFMDECLQNLVDVVENQEEVLSKMILQEKISHLIQTRLEMQVPYISRWAQALSIQANPANLPTSFKQRAALVDEIWHAAGDRSSDMDWYAKRGMVGAIYTASELYMLTDYSPGFQETWSFVKRRVRDALDCRKTTQEMTQLAQAIGAGLGSSLQSLFRR